MLMTLSTIIREQSKAIVKTTNLIKILLDYLDTHPESTLQNRALYMVI